jgi:hypothetical protein
MSFFDITILDYEQKFALFYGIMLGDGCLSQYVDKAKRERFCISITGCASDDWPFYKYILTDLLKSFGRKSVSIKKRSNCGAIEINFPDKILFDKFHFYGFPIGKKGPALFIPSYFYEKDLVGLVVAGFIATDGSLVLTKNPHKYYPRIEGNGISKKLITQIQEYLIKMGMNGAVYLAKRKNVNPRFNIQPQYRFQFNGKENLLLFENLVGFVNLKHQKKFEEFLAYDKMYNDQIKGIASQKQKFIRIQEIGGSGGS